MNITIFNEYHPAERTGKAAKVYPEGIHSALASIFRDIPDVTVRTATQEDSEHGLSEEVLRDTDVLIWWSKDWYNEVLESVAAKVKERVSEGMGAIFLHSGKNSKPFKALMGTSCATNPDTKHREGGEEERLYITCPSHPIAEGVPNGYVIPNAEPYCEFFDIPEPDETIFTGWFAGGSVVRAGVTFRRGRGKIFYFQPGHETYPIYHDEIIRKIIFNAVNWAKPASTSITNYVPEKQQGGIKKKLFKFFK